MEIIVPKAATRYQIIESVAEKYTHIKLVELFKIAGVSKSGYYAWKAAAGARKSREDKDRKDFERILEAYKFRGYDKGVQGIYMRLLHKESDRKDRMGQRRIRRLMHKYGLKCPIRKANPYRRIAQAMKTNNVAPNMLHRQFEQFGPRVVLLTDITYLPYRDGNDAKFAYLSTIIDAYTKQVLSYVVSNSLFVDIVLDTVNQLIDNHKDELSTDTIVHSDQGCHYTSHKFIEILKNKSLRQSMSRKGNCWDNAPQESFFGHMKDHIDERLASCRTFEAVKAVVDDYIDYYNNERYQWDLAKLSPNEYYEFITTGFYPIKDVDPPSINKNFRDPKELGKVAYEVAKTGLQA